MNKCSECSGNEFSFDERLGETVCDSCGLVILTNPFEETKRVLFDDLGQSNIQPDNGKLGSYIWSTDSTTSSRRHNFRVNQIRGAGLTSSQKKAKSLINMYLSEYQISKRQRENCISMYMRLDNLRLLMGYSIERRAAGITYFFLKDLEIVCSLKQHAKLTDVEMKYIVRISKICAKHFRKSFVFSNIDVFKETITILDLLKVKDGNFREQCINFVNIVNQKYQALDRNMSKTDIAASVWLCSELAGNEEVTQRGIVRVYPTTEVSIRTATDRLVETWGYEKRDARKMKIEEFV